MATYYTDYKNGNDTTGTGATGAPWKTLTKFLAACANGDTCLVRGNNTDNATFYYDADMSTSKTNLTVRADVGHTPVFTRAALYTDWAKSGGYTNVYEKSTSQTYGVWNGATALTLAANLAACDATPNSYYWSSPKTYVNLDGGDPDDIGGLRSNISAQAIIVASGAGFTWDGIGIQWVMRSIQLAAANCTVKNSTIAYMNQSNGWPYGGVAIDAVSGCVVDGCTIDEVRNFVSAHESGSAVLLNAGASNATVKNCIIRNGCNGVFLIDGNGTGHVIERNTVSDMWRNFVDASSGSFTMRWNTIVNCGGGAMRQGGTSIAVVYGNTYRLTGTLAGPTGSNWAFITETGGTGYFYHNTIANLKLSSAGGRAGFLIQQNTSVGTYYNNIAYNCDTGYLIGSGTTPTVTHSNNCSYGNTTNTIFGAAVAAPNVGADPLFTNAATYDFTLQPGSPCIDAGVTVAGINDGYLGAAPDIGRYEYTPTGAPRQMMHYAKMRQQ